MWKSIENYNSLYEVNEKGEIRSLYHWNGHKYEKRKKPYILKQSNTTTGYKKVELAKDGKKKRTAEAYGIVKDPARAYHYASIPVC